MKYLVNKFEVDLTHFLIWCDSEQVACEPKVFDLILFLIVSRDRVVSRDELFNEVWGGREVSDATLSNHIKNARRVLDDDGDKQNVIRTVRGRGYQFVADVQEGVRPNHDDSIGNTDQDNQEGAISTDNERISDHSLRNSWWRSSLFRVAALLSFSGLLAVVAFQVSNRHAVQQEGATEPSSDSLNYTSVNGERTALGSLPTTNLAAYELYISGQREMSLLTHDSLRKSVNLFEQAINLDPNLEVAHLAKADAFRILMAYFERPVEVLPKVIESVANALALNPSSAKARSSLGFAYVLAWRWKDAWDMLNQAQQLDPSLVETQIGLALYYSGVGNVQGVHRSLSKANSLDPLNVELADWGHWSLVMVGEVDAALSWAQSKLQLHPEVGMIYSGASVSASLSGDHARAVALAQKGVDLDSGSPYSLLALAQTYGYSENGDRMKPLIDGAMQKDSYVCPYELGISYLLLGDLDSAFMNFDRAVVARSNCLIFTRNDPRLISIKNDPRYHALLTRVGLSDDSIRKMKIDGRFD